MKQFYQLSSIILGTILLVFGIWNLVVCISEIVDLYSNHETLTTLFILKNACGFLTIPLTFSISYKLNYFFFKGNKKDAKNIFYGTIVLQVLYVMLGMLYLVYFKGVYQNLAGTVFIISSFIIHFLVLIFSFIVMKTIKNKK